MDRMAIDHVLLGAPEEVWHAITQPAAVSSWFTRCRRIGQGQYALTFDEPEGPHTKKLVVLDCDQRSALRLRARLEDPGYNDSIVDVRLHEHPVTEQTVTMLRLVHEQLPPELVDGYRTGWPGYLSALTDYIGARS